MSELKNMTKRMSDPMFFMTLSHFYATKIIEKISNRFRSKTYWYPALVYEKFKTMQSTTNQMVDVDHQKQLDQIKINSCTLKLASGEIAIDDQFDWQLESRDDEQIVSLHRWNWLLHWILDKSFANRNTLHLQGLLLIEKWCRHESIHPLAFESYSTGERICNALLFITFTHPDGLSPKNLPAWLTHHLLAMATQLAGKIEYFAPHATCNHILNNARALYFAGQFLAKESFSKIAVTILKNDLATLIDRNGFLREGSSHYQFLITRWLLEIAWLAELTHDHDTQQFLAPFLNRMLAQCWFFLVFDRSKLDWHIPLFGDVSPDFQVSWLINLPWTQLAKQYYRPENNFHAPRTQGFGQLFDPALNLQANESVIPDLQKQAHLRAYPESGWYRLDWHDITIFWHVETTGTPHFASHGHCDTGSFCLYWQGKAIFIDPGRYNYCLDDALGIYGMSAPAHNNLTIDSHQPFIYHNRFKFPPCYKNSRVDVNHVTTSDHVKLTIEHDGFARIHGDQIMVKRTFIISPNQLLIEDCINGKGCHNIETYFQCAPDLKITEGILDNTLALSDALSHFNATFVDHHQQKKQLCKGQVTPEIAGWCFNRYGEKQPTTTIKYSTQLTLPSVLRYTLDWME